MDETARTPDSELDYWRLAAEQWIEKSDVIEHMTAPVSAALVARLAPKPGQRILDTACGAGDPALAIAARVGSSGLVMATDGVGEMVAALRARVEDEAWTQVRVEQVAAEELSFEAGSFDGACSRFGVMFFPDPREALSRMATCVHPGGRLIVAAWGSKDCNAYFTCVSAALDEVGAPPVPSRRTVFEFGESPLLLETARQAGWREAREERLPFEMILPETRPDQLLERQRALSGKIAERCEPLGEALCRQAAELVAERVAGFVRGDGLALPAEALFVSGVA